MLSKIPYSIIVLLFILSSAAHGQMKRERVNPGGPVDETFWAPNIVGMGTVENLAAQNMNVTIMHSFGIATERTIDNFFGLDIPPNVRLGLDYGITKNWSAGIGRTTFEKVVDIRTKLALLRQTRSGSIPLSLSAKGDIAVTTRENNRPFSDDLNYFASLIAGKKISDQLSLQVAPMYTHFNTINVSAGEVHDLFAIGLGGEYHLSRRYALAAEYYPVIGDKNPGTKNAFALGISIETGGHVFQMFFASATWHNEQYIIARNRENFWEGDFRFGFNVNRLFFLGKNQ